jgi:hypothetical protein
MFIFNARDDFIPFSPIAAVILSLEKDSEDDGADKSYCNVGQDNAVPQSIPRRIFCPILS